MRKTIVILGAGLTGLMVAHRLSKNDKDVIIIEKGNQVGGLAKTINKDGFRFDLGGHRFYCENKDIEKEIVKLMGKNLLNIKKSSKIFLKNRCITYPPRLKNIVTSFSVFEIINMLKSYFWSKLKKKSEDSLETWLVNRFGKGIYDLYFKGYSEKVWGIPCSSISKDWASERIQVSGLMDIIRTLYGSRDKPAKESIDRFFYPVKGIGTISEKLKTEISKKNKILLNSKLIQINHKDKKIESVILERKNRKYKIFCEYLVSTIPLKEFINLMNPPLDRDILRENEKIKYRSLILIFLTIKKRKIMKSHWGYFPDKSIGFARMSEPKNWSRHMCKKNETSLCLEIFCDYKDKIWRTEQALLAEKCIKDLEKMNFLKRKEIKSWFIKKITHAYPLYYKGYSLPLKKIRKYLQEFENLQIAGRNGAHRYLDMEGCIEGAFRTANNINNISKKTHL